MLCRRMWRSHLARTVSPLPAGLLARVRDDAVEHASTRDAEKVQLPELRNAGLIRAQAARSGHGVRWELNNDVRYRLLLDE
jgi:hypothetical protein